MKYYKVWPEYTQEQDNEGHYAKWVDDDLFLMNVCVFRDRSILNEWPADLRLTPSDEGHVCDVLSNPNSLFYSQRVVDKVGEILGNSVEWLPAMIEGLGPFFMLHPLIVVELGPDARVKQNDVSGNYTWIDKYDFTLDGNLPSCFLIAQAEGSAARMGGYCMSDVIVDDTIRWKLAEFRGIDFAMIYQRQ